MHRDFGLATLSGNTIDQQLLRVRRQQRRPTACLGILSTPPGLRADRLRRLSARTVRTNCPRRLSARTVRADFPRGGSARTVRVKAHVSNAMYVPNAIHIQQYSSSDTTPYPQCTRLEGEHLTSYFLFSRCRRGSYQLCFGGRGPNPEVSFAGCCLGLAIGTTPANLQVAGRDRNNACPQKLPKAHRITRILPQGCVASAAHRAARWALRR